MQIGRVVLVLAMLTGCRRGEGCGGGTSSRGEPATKNATTTEAPLESNVARASQQVPSQTAPPPAASTVYVYVPVPVAAVNVDASPASEGGSVTIVGGPKPTNEGIQNMQPETTASAEAQANPASAAPSPPIGQAAASANPQPANPRSNGAPDAASAGASPPTDAGNPWAGYAEYFPRLPAYPYGFIIPLADAGFGDAGAGNF